MQIKSYGITASAYMGLSVPPDISVDDLYTILCQMFTTGHVSKLSGGELSETGFKQYQVEIVFTNNNFDEMVDSLRKAAKQVYEAAFIKDLENTING